MHLNTFDENRCATCVQFVSCAGVQLFGHHISSMASFSLSPDPLTFGCVSVGYAYSMRVVLTSFTSYLERFKIEIKNNEDTSNKIKCHYSLKPLAPGMQLVIKLTFNARECNHNNFPLSITLASTKTAQVFNVSALVVPPENFKKTARNLRFNGKSIYPPGVDCIGAISQTQSSFIGQGAPSIYSENLVTEEDLEVHIVFFRIMLK